MEFEKYFLVQIKRTTQGAYDKGVVIKDTLDEARQSYHAYLGAYGFGHDTTIDYVACYIVDMAGLVRDSIVDNRIPILEVPDPDRL